MNPSTILNPALAGLSTPAAAAPRPAPFVPFRKVSLRAVIWSLLLGVGLVCPALLLVAQFPVPGITSRQVLLIAQNLPLVLLGSVVVGPLLEEVIFRGCFIQLGRRYVPVAVAAALSTAVFSAIHFPKGLGVVVLALPMGALFAWLAVRSRSLWPGFLCHAAFNLTAYIVTAASGILEKNMVHSAGTPLSTAITGSLPAGWLAASAVLAGVGAVMLARDLARKREGAPAA